MNITVSRNAKLSHNYNSQGYGVSITAELDQALLTNPARLQDELDRLYQQADLALNEQIEKDSSAGTHTREISGDTGDNRRGDAPSARSNNTYSNGSRHHSSHTRWRQTGDNPIRSGDSRPRNHARQSSSRSSRGNPGGGTSGGMTESQGKAIYAICRKLGIDGAEELRHELGMELDDLSVKEASQFIDHLKQLQQERR
jgi:hypothetical protein